MLKKSIFEEFVVKLLTIGKIIVGTSVCTLFLNIFFHVVAMQNKLISRDYLSAISIYYLILSFYVGVLHKNSARRFTIFTYKVVRATINEPFPAKPYVPGAYSASFRNPETPTATIMFLHRRRLRASPADFTRSASDRQVAGAGSKLDFVNPIHADCPN